MNFDVPRLIGAVTRVLTDRVHEGRRAHVITATRTYDAGLEDVWDALTDPKRIPRWFLPVSGDLRLGGRYQLEGNAGGEITRCEPPKELGLTWEMRGDTSYVSVRLSAEGPVTRLELEHVAHVPDEFWDQYGPGAVGVGWELALTGLYQHLATGAAVDPKAFEAWSTSEAGRAFVKGSSEGWREASIAGGTPVDSATAAAARTTAFYTGEPQA